MSETILSIRAMPSTTDRKAIPTEYQGVVFKSKSEAIFAHNLTLGGILWEYEPEYWVIDDGWCPDFLVSMRWRAAQNHPPRVGIAIIEYKPCEPTLSYLDNLGQKYVQIAEEGLSLCRFHLAYGSSFEPEKERGIWTFSWSSQSWSKDIHDPDINNFTYLANLDAARSYRFDLKH